MVYYCVTQIIPVFVQKCIYEVKYLWQSGKLSTVTIRKSLFAFLSEYTDICLPSFLVLFPFWQLLSLPFLKSSLRRRLLLVLIWAWTCLVQPVAWGIFLIITLFLWATLFAIMAPTSIRSGSPKCVWTVIADMTWMFTFSEIVILQFEPCWKNGYVAVVVVRKSVVFPLQMPFKSVQVSKSLGLVFMISSCSLTRNTVRANQFLHWQLPVTLEWDQTEILQKCSATN